MEEETLAQASNNLDPNVLPGPHANPSDVYVVVPAYNEGPVLAATISGLLPYGYSIVVVDDGSVDHCLEMVSDLPVHRLRHPVNLGQGAALQTGVDYAIRCGAQFIVHFDADGQHPAEQIADLLEPLLEGKYDVTLGSRFMRYCDEERVPWFKRLALRIGVQVSGLFTGVWLTDTHNGFRALSRKAACLIRLRENGFAHATEFLDLMRRANLRYQEVPTTITYTDYAIRKGQRLSNGLTIVLDLLMRRIVE